MSVQALTHVGMYMSCCAHVGQRTTCRNQFSFYHICPRDWTQVVRLHGRHLYLLRRAELSQNPPLFLIRIPMWNKGGQLLKSWKQVFFSETDVSERERASWALVGDLQRWLCILSSFKIYFYWCVWMFVSVYVMYADAPWRSEGSVKSPWIGIPGSCKLLDGHGARN